MERDQLALAALLGGHQRRVRAPRAGRIEVGPQPLEIGRHGVGLRPSAPCSSYAADRRRASSRSRAGLGGGAGGLQRRAQHEVRVAVARLAAHGLAQPVHGRREVLLPPVGVAQVERVVGLRGIGLDGLVEEVGRASVLRGRAAPQLNHAEVVEHLRRAGLVSQRLQSRKGLVVLRERDLGHRGLELRARRVGRTGGHGQRRVPRLVPVAGHRVRAAQRQPRAIEGGFKRQRPLEKADLGVRRLGQQPFDELLEGRQRRPRVVRGGRRRRRPAPAGGRRARRSRAGRRAGRARRTRG